MRFECSVPGLTLLLLLGGCGKTTTEDTQPGPPLPIRSFVLHDVQGLFGGNALWAGEDRTAWLQVVSPPPPGKTGLWEKRYKVTITAEQWASVEKKLGEIHFLAAKG